MDNSENKFNPRLCTGTFFTLLIGARKQRGGSRKRDYKTSDGLNNPNMLFALMRTVNPDYEVKESPQSRTLTSITSAIKNCTKDRSEYYDPDILKEKYNEIIEEDRMEDYQAACESFIEEYISGGKNNRKLATALLWMIQNDPELNTDANISAKMGDYIAGTVAGMSDGGVVEVYLPAIFGACWSYILNHVPENSCGQDTVDYWKSFKKESDILDDILKLVDFNVITVIEDKNTRIRKSKERLSSLAEGIAPEVLPQEDQGFYIVMEKGSVKIDPPSPTPRFDNYLKAATEKYGTVKTLLYDKEPVDFYSFYVPNDILSYRLGRGSINPLIDSLYADLKTSTRKFRQARPRKMIITGMGGLGKSMMMRHLFLQASERQNTFGRVPFLIPLKGYKSDQHEIIQLILVAARVFDSSLNANDILDLLKEGKAILLFDGLDEISLDLRNGFEEKLNSFSDAYMNNPMVVSSRPYSKFVALDQFTTYRLCPFNRTQALEMIDKLDFQSDAPEIKERFVRALKERLFRTHLEFTQNPLLLTLMLMTFNYNGDIPQGLTGFYREAFETLAKRHDASKPGLERIMETHLDTDGLAQLLSLFCALSFVNHKYDYQQHEMVEYFEKAKELFVGTLDARATDFITDVKDNICLMYFEDARYHYIHRSFQEYFTALYFSKINDDKLPRVAEFVNKTGAQAIDMLDMLYTMIQLKVEQFIFLPYLKNLFAECDSDDIDSYLSFICSEYPYLEATDGETDVSANNAPAHALYQFIAKKSNLKANVDTYMFPTNEWYLRSRYVFATDDPGVFDKPEEWDLMDEEEVSDEFKRVVGSGEFAGALCSYDMYDIIHDVDSVDNAEIVDIISNEDFSLKIEYECMRKYTAALTEKFSKPESGDFGLF